MRVPPSGNFLPHTLRRLRYEYIRGENTALKCQRLLITTKLVIFFNSVTKGLGIRINRNKSPFVVKITSRRGYFGIRECEALFHFSPSYTYTHTRAAMKRIYFVLHFFNIRVLSIRNTKKQCIPYNAPRNPLIKFAGDGNAILLELVVKKRKNAKRAIFLFGGLLLQLEKLKIEKCDNFSSVK